jgi:hypothetical protein
MMRANQGPAHTGVSRGTGPTLPETDLSKSSRESGKSSSPQHSRRPGCDQGPGGKWHSLDSSSAKSNRSAVACGYSSGSGPPVRKQDKDQAARIVLIDNFNHKALDDLLFSLLPQVVRRAASPITVVESEPPCHPAGAHVVPGADE